MAVQEQLVAARRRGRPAEQQREQKRATREKILEAGRVILEHHAYARTTIDMIAAQAGISRATFYRHFDSKRSVAMVLFEGLGAGIVALWRNLLDLHEPSRDDISDWLTRHIELSGRNKVVGAAMRELDFMEPEMQPLTLRFYQSLIAMMWDDSTKADLEYFAAVSARSLLMLLQLDEFLVALLARNWAIDHPPLIDAMAALLGEFLEFRDRALAGGMAGQACEGDFPERRR